MEFNIGVQRADWEKIHEYNKQTIQNYESMVANLVKNLEQYKDLAGNLQKENYRLRNQKPTEEKPN